MLSGDGWTRGQFSSAGAFINVFNRVEEAVS